MNKNKWINVKKRLPPDANLIWIFNKDRDVCLGKYLEGKWILEEGEEIAVLQEAIGWLPLIKPYPPSLPEKDKFFTIRVSDFDLENINELAKRLDKNKGESIRLVVKEVLNALKIDENKEGIA